MFCHFKSNYYFHSKEPAILSECTILNTKSSNPMPSIALFRLNDSDTAQACRHQDVWTVLSFSEHYNTRIWLCQNSRHIQAPPSLHYVHSLWTKLCNSQCVTITGHLFDVDQQNGGKDLKCLLSTTRRKESSLTEIAAKRLLSKWKHYNGTVDSKTGT